MSDTIYHLQEARLKRLLSNNRHAVNQGDEITLIKEIFEELVRFEKRISSEKSIERLPISIKDPYVEIFYTSSSPNYHMTICTLNCTIHKWDEHWVDRKIKHMLVADNGVRPSVPWNKIRKGLKWSAKIDTNSHVWLDLIGKLEREILDKRKRLEREILEAKMKYPEVVEARKCKIEIKFGEHEGRVGFFSRYFVDDEDIFIKFSTINDKRGVTSLVDYDAEKLLGRKPWKQIVEGAVWVQETTLAPWTVERVGAADRSHYKGLYVNLAPLDRSAFL